MKRSMLLAAAVLLLVTSAVSARRGTRNIEKSLDMKMGGRMDIEILIGGDIAIEGWDRDEVLVKAVISGRQRDEVELDFDLDGDALGISAEIDRQGNYDANCDLHIRVPAEMDIEFETMGGDVEIEGVEGRISGRTMGGDLDFEEISGHLAVISMGGDIAVISCEVDGKVKTMGGDVEIKDVKGDLKGSTMGGDVTYENVVRPDGGDDEVTISTMGGDLVLDYAGKNIKAETYGGDIEVARAEKVNVTTMGGDINIDEAPVGAKVKTMGGDIEIGMAGAYVDAETMGGDITVEDIDGWVKAVTMGGDVEVTMTGDPDEGERDVEIKSMGGDIDLTVPRGLSMRFDIEIQWTENHDRKPKIVSDLDIKIKETGEWEKRNGRKRKYIYGTGKVGGGKHLIKIRTVNGDVHIGED
jgi:DUF4097 and DUF4098 domain-containing protein YvlB